MSTTHEQDTTATNGQDTAMSDAPTGTDNPLTRLALGIMHDQLDENDPAYVLKSQKLKDMCSRFGITDINQCALKTRSTRGGGSGSEAGDEDDDDDDNGDPEVLHTLMKDYRGNDDPEENEEPQTEADKADREVRLAAERYINRQLLEASKGSDTTTQVHDAHDDELLGAVLDAYNRISSHTAAQDNTISDSQQLASSLTIQAQDMTNHIQAMYNRLNEQDGLINQGYSVIESQRSNLNALQTALAPFLAPILGPAVVAAAGQVMRSNSDSWPGRP